MNADFEFELAHSSGLYRCPPTFEALNRKLSAHLLWLTNPGDGLLLTEPWDDSLVAAAQLRGVELVSPVRAKPQSGRLFTPWGWTRSAARTGMEIGAVVSHVPLEVVARVNSKLWSHALEVEQGWAQAGAATASNFEELCEAVAHACPGADDKWVIKSPYGFAARERVLGRGPVLAGPQASWVVKRFARGETLIFQPWLEVVREYGIVAEIKPDGSHMIFGVSDMLTNGAGTTTGYILGRPPTPLRMDELRRTAAVVCGRLFFEGYYGPVGIDAVEHAGGLHPLLEINARYTMGFIAVAMESSVKPFEPIVWNPK
jgi:hypothetical protein